MKLKKLGLALVVVCALGVVMASSAFAAATTTPATWRTGSGGTVLTGSLTATSTLTETGVLTTEVGSTPLVLESTGLECKECTIFNEGGGAKGSGKLKFTGVTVKTPPACAASSGTLAVGNVETNALKVDATYMIGSTNYIEFAPASGTTFVVLKLAKGSGTCPIAGNYIISGKVFVESKNATGVYEASQVVKSSEAINATAGGSLKLGEKPASLKGAAAFSVGGTVFGTHE